MVNKQKIPKVIHYCWFGGNPLPELAIKCIESWKKYCPDYEIKEWNESNFDINSCDYIKEAYEAKKWAFVSDYARFWILYYEGGLYFDTDVELIRSIDDIIERGNFMACEKAMNVEVGTNIAPGLGIAANPGLEIYREILDFYEKKHFLREDGNIDVTTIVKYTTDILKKYGFESKNEIQLVADIYIYPPEYFCPKDYQTEKINITENTRAIHHYSESWHGIYEKGIKKIENFFGKYGKTGKRIGKMICFPLHVLKKIEHIGIRRTLKVARSKIKKKLLNEK